MRYKWFFAVGVKRGYWMRQMNVFTAFVYGFLYGVIYVKQPHLFATELDKVCKLIKTFYRLKHAPHVRYKTVVKFPKKLGFIQLELDHGISASTDKQLYIAVYVDDLLIFGSDIARLEDVQQKLLDRFKMTELGDISDYLGMKFNHVVGERITLCQSTYLNKLLGCFNMIECKPAFILMDP